jgi:hypothetical protein
MAAPLPIVDMDLILADTRDIWHEARGQRFFLTGGTGFFGCWLVESFCHVNQMLSLGAEITILTRSPEAFSKKCPHLASDPAVKLHVGDVRNFVFPSGEYRYVIHAATEARARQAEEAPLEMLSTIVAGTERTLEFAATHGAKKFLLTSSGAVYGKQPDGMTHVLEDYESAPDPLKPASVYAEGKRISELLCAIYQKRTGLECKIARCWASADRIFHWMSILPSETSLVMCLQAVPFRFRAMVRRGDLIYTLPTLSSGYGLFYSRPLRSCPLTWVRQMTSAF